MLLESEMPEVARECMKKLRTVKPGVYDPFDISAYISSHVADRLVMRPEPLVDLGEVCFETLIGLCDSIDADGRAAIENLAATMTGRWDDAEALEQAADWMQAAGTRCEQQSMRLEGVERVVIVTQALFGSAILVKLARRRAADLRAGAAETTPETATIAEKTAAVA